MSSDPWIPVGSVLTTCPYSDYSFANALHASRSRIGGAWILDTNWNRDFLPSYNTKRGNRATARDFIYLFFSYPDGKRAGNRGRGREDKGGEDSRD